MMKELVLRASGKTTAKMLEEANERLELAESALKAAGFTQASPSNQWKPPVGPSASPLLQRIDDLSTQRDELLSDMQDVLDMLINQPHAVTAANQAEDMLRLSIGTAKYFAKAGSKNHSPDAAKMVPEGSAAPATNFHIGQPVKKVTGEYKISGVVRSVFAKSDGAVRLVVEHTVKDEHGEGSFLHIYGPNNLEPLPEGGTA